MSMTEGERIRRIQEEANRYVSRSKVRDSSELTFIRQAKASKNVIPATVSSMVTRDGDCCNVTIKGKGTNMEYLNVLQGARGCATCSDVEPSLLPGIYIPAPCYDRSQPPFAQKNLSTGYVPACTPGFNQFFPTVPRRGETCNLPNLPFDSA
jgi:hypothetical protein